MNNHPPDDALLSRLGEGFRSFSFGEVHKGGTVFLSHCLI